MTETYAEAIARAEAVLSQVIQADTQARKALNNTLFKAFDAYDEALARARSCRYTGHIISVQGTPTP